MTTERNDARAIRALRDAPDWAVEAEWARRQGKTPRERVAFGRVILDPRARKLVWGRVLYALTGRQTELLHVLIRARLDGHERVPRRYVSERMYPEIEPQSAAALVSEVAMRLDKRVPGLLLRSGYDQIGYGLNTRPRAEAEGAA